MIAFAVILAGCTSDDDRPSFGDLRGDASDMAERVIEKDVTAFADLPTNGSAIYDGFVVLEAGLPGGEETIAGEITVVANFGNGKVGADIFNLVGENVGDIDGTISGKGGQIYRDPVGDAGFRNLNLDGVLEIDGERADFDGEMSGAFLGNKGDSVVGLISGDVTIDGEVSDVDGAFIGEK